MKFNAVDALPISDVFIAKQYYNDGLMQWKLFDVHKINYGYDIEIVENGMIIATASANELGVVGANFSSSRRQNLKGAIVCFEFLKT